MITLEELTNERLREQISLLFDALSFVSRASHVLVVFDENGQIVDTTSLPFSVSIMALRQVFSSPIRECISSHEDPSSLVVVSMTNIDTSRDPSGHLGESVTAIREDFQKLAEEYSAGFIVLGATDQI